MNFPHFLERRNLCVSYIGFYHTKMQFFRYKNNNNRKNAEIQEVHNLLRISTAALQGFIKGILMEI